MIRQHQFTKVELVSITTPENSLVEHERMLGCAEEVLKRLGLAYRVVTLCTGDMGFASQKPMTSRSGCQGRTAIARFHRCPSAAISRRADECALSPRGRQGDAIRPYAQWLGRGRRRALVAVLENYQNEDGSVAVPDALQPYMGGLAKIEEAR